jgi:hypothetical protein
MEACVTVDKNTGKYTVDSIGAPKKPTPKTKIKA